MRHISKLAVLSAVILALSACTSAVTSAAPTTAASPTPSTVAPAPTPTASEVECPATPLDVAIAYELVADARGGITINAESNLPDGAEMGASFFILGEFLAQDDGVLKDGKVTFGPFSDDGTPLHGTYEMSVTLPIASTQSDNVQKCIGTAGESLTGALVITDEISGDKYASLDVPVTFE